MARRAGWTVPALADAYLAGGARLLQVRCKNASSVEFLANCEEVVTRARKAGAMVIVNDRADIARLAGADGVHVGQDDLEPASVRQILDRSAIIGLSTHSADQVRAGARLPVDYIAVGPVFGTRTKDTGYREVGLDLVGEAAEILRGEHLSSTPLGAGAVKPIVAIGGITLDLAPDVIRAGAASVAIISDLLSTGNPEARVRDYLRVLG